MFPGVHAASTPDKPAAVLAGTGETLTYRQLDEASLRLAHVFRAAGLRRGDVVGIVTDNRLEAFEVYWAALRSGLYFTAINHHLAAEEVEYILRDADVKALVVSAGKAELAAAVRPAADVAVALAFGGPVAGYDDYAEVLAAASTDPLPEQPRGMMMLYSSGTTGRPKGVRPPLPRTSVDEPGDPLVQLNHDVYGVDADTVYLSPAPIYHSAPVKWCHSVHAYGGTVVMMERFDAEATLRSIERYRVTHAQFVPTMLIRILKLDPGVRARYDVSSLRVAVHAAAPCPVEVKEAIIAEWGPIVWEYYGSTESLGVTIIDSEQALARPGSVGKPVLGVLHICDSDGRELPAGEVGTVYFEREYLPFRYHKDDERTRSAQHPEHPNWGTVGDLGYVDSDGYLYLTDRKAFLIISGGVNIYPQEVENALALHPKVADVAVVGVPDPEMGESVAAFVEVPAGVEPSDELATELREFVRARIAHYKAPRTVTFVDALPRTPTGKLVKGRLRGSSSHKS
ncbi:acyl-CoA synthetase [Sporichthya polymorpha]|uniref:acyl-CoA synthetase n=1 Tax=Sporichthya polymorpha TaxID=35751 RepID=UPI0003746935|nr:acyl-CoA synthetase [Sporichthya polymorpha]